MLPKGLQGFRANHPATPVMVVPLDGKCCVVKPEASIGKRSNVARVLSFSTNHFVHSHPYCPCTLVAMTVPRGYAHC